MFQNIHTFWLSCYIAIHFYQTYKMVMTYKLLNTLNFSVLYLHGPYKHSPVHTEPATTCSQQLYS